MTSPLEPHEPKHKLLQPHHKGSSQSHGLFGGLEEVPYVNNVTIVNMSDGYFFSFFFLIFKRGGSISHEDH
jgi:hypothetical protein